MSRVYSLLLSVAVVVIALDQWSKHLVLENFHREGETVPVLSWFSFTLVHNHAAAFGMFHQIPESIRTVFFLLLPLVVLAILWATYVRNFGAAEVLGPVAMGLVLGGALGNFIDRIRHGYVIDFIDWFYAWSGGHCAPGFVRFDPATCHWPVFNVADSAITFAMFLLIIYSIAQGRQIKSQQGLPAKKN